RKVAAKGRSRPAARRARGLPCLCPQPPNEKTERETSGPFFSFSSRSAELSGRLELAIGDRAQREKREGRLSWQAFQNCDSESDRGSSRSRCRRRRNLG